MIERGGWRTEDGMIERGGWRTEDKRYHQSSLIPRPRPSSLVPPMTDRIYTVPNRFGLFAVLLIMAIFASVFTVTKAVDAQLRVTAPLLSFILLVCLAQMAFGSVPRRASAIVGGLLFPISALVDPIFNGRFRLQTLTSLDWFWLVTCGLLAGYCGGVLLAGIFLISDCLPEKKDRVYSVPQKFGTGTMLLATTMFAILFAILTYAEVRLWQLVFFTSYVVTVSVAQMFVAGSPRWASIFAGGIFLPMSILSYGRVGRYWRLSIDSGVSLLGIVLIGVVVGYLGGALIAGIFLVSDYMVKLLTRPKAKVGDEAMMVDEPMEGGTLSLLAQRAVANRQKAS
jgi:MFS family permease